ncbi:MAG: UvrD-helicase domain-containing protein [Muribaculaceae bacterium]|nr:UvrD-helicase domain-containing protein [Muribaculaceae bacterium]
MSVAETSYLDRLNDAQCAAVEYLGGPELVIAGAGSGKTRVLTYKIVHLLHCGHSPRHILALTFTNKAAREMRERICRLTGEQTAQQLWMGTFHSIFSRFLRMHADRIGFNSNYTIYDTSDTKSLIKSIIRELQLDDKLYRPGAVLADISNAKNNLYSPEDYAADVEITRANADARRPRMADIYRIYRDRCRIAGAMDFDDLLFYTNVLLRDNPDVLERFRSYFSYILVDEYQDTNFAQHLIVRQLAGESQNLCVVGDDAQSIYSFRGANIRNILDLKKSFPLLRTFKLEQNYRSTQNIVSAANTLIAANREQIPKEVFSRKEEGERIEVVQAYNDFEEAYIVANRIAQVRMRYNLPLSDIAVLYRTNAQSRVLEEALRNRNVPYRIYGGLAFYQRKEIKDAVCYFRLSVNPDDDEALRRVINTPKRGIGETTVKKVLARAIASGVSMYRVMTEPETYGLDVNRGTAAKLAAFAALVRDFTGRADDGDNALVLARHIIQSTGLMNEYKSDATPENVSKLQNLEELLKAVATFVENTRETRGEEAIGMADFLAEISLMTDQDTDEGDGDSVTMMTIHSAKGLEFECVFVVGVEEDLLPSAMSMHSASEIEEERRLMYVALTRAKRFCMVSYARQRAINGKTVQTFPSRFLRDIEPRYLRLMTGSSLDGPRAYGARGGTRHDASVMPSQPVRSSQPMPSVQARPAVDATPKPKAKAPVSSDGHGTHAASELAEGQRINHPNFGLGIIRRIDTSMADDRIVVEFSATGTRRTLLLKFARFTILS